MATTHGQPECRLRAIRITSGCHLETGAKVFPPHHRSKRPMTAPARKRATPLHVSDLRVAKRIGPDRAGSKMHSRKYGDDLVCVRHRIDPAANVRYVTVELVVDAIPIVSRMNDEVAVHIGPSQKSLRSDLLAFGARWDTHAKVWRMPRSVARTLRLLRNVLPRSGRTPASTHGKMAVPVAGSGCG